MKKLIAALMAGLFSVAVAGTVYAGEAKGDEKKSDSGMEKGKGDASKKKGSGKKDEKN